MKLLKWQTLALLTVALGCGGTGENGDEPEGIDLVQGEITSGAVYVIKGVGSGKCVDVTGASTAAGAVIEQWDCNNKTNQQFKLTSKTGGFEAVAINSGLCLDVFQANTANGAKIDQWGCNGHTSQRWAIVGKGSGQFQLKAANSGKCLQPAGESTAKGAALQQWTCADKNSQKFTLTAVSGGSPPPPPPPPPSGGGLTFRKANLTNFTSYPDPGSEECIKFNGCMWAGQFAFIDGTQSKSWVMSHNIAAVHEKDGAKYKLKTLRLKQGSHQIDVKVYDECADSDCSGCCTANSRQTGFLIDLESFTADRFGSGDGVVDWACLDCN